MPAHTSQSQACCCGSRCCRCCDADAGAAGNPAGSDGQQCRRRTESDCGSGGCQPQNKNDLCLGTVSSSIALPSRQRKLLATKAFHVSSHYDTAIFNYFNEDETIFKTSISEGQILRYGENPHQKGFFFGDFDKMFTKVHGKELSYNNLLDVDAFLMRRRILLLL